MSQISPQPQGPHRTSLPIAKFSHNSCQVGVRNFVWNHVGVRNDMEFVVQNTKAVDDFGNYVNRIVMKVTAGAETLEFQDLGELVKICRETDLSSGVEHPIQVVTKSPFLAMRYPQAAANNVRRIQLKFKNDADFAKAWNILMELGLPITESTPPNVPSSTAIVPFNRPLTISPAPSIFSTTSTASSKTIIPSNPTPLLQQEQSRLLTSSARPVMHASPTKSLFKIPARPDSSMSGVPRPSSVPSFFKHQNTASSSNSDPYSAIANSFNRATSRAPSLYASQIERQLPNRRLSYPVLLSPSQSEIDSSVNMQLESQTGWQSSLNTPQQPLSRFVTSSPFFSPQPNDPHHASYPAEHDQSLHSVGDIVHRMNLGRQASIIKDVFDDIVCDTMPPKRILPFPSPRDSNKVRSPSASDISGLPKAPPAPRADSTVNPSNASDKAIPTPTSKPAKKRVAQRKVPVAKVVENEILDEEPPVLINKGALKAGKIGAQEDEISPLAAKSAAANRTTSALSGLQSKAIVTKKRAAPRPSSTAKRPKMVDQGTQTQTVSGRNHTVAQRPGSSNDALTFETPVAHLPVALPANYLDVVDAFVTHHRDRPSPKELWETPGYSAADDDERKALLNDFICENLENADFLQLCKDTETAWRRAGLGM